VGSAVVQRPLPSELWVVCRAVGVVGKKKTGDTVRKQGGDVGKQQGTCGA
jgi:hypothetical protein